MPKKLMNSGVDFFLMVILGTVVLLACGDGSGASSSAGHATRDTGTISFNLDWEMPTDHHKTKSSSDDVCVDFGIDTIDAVLRNANDNTIIAQEQWPCKEHSGTIAGISAPHQMMRLTLIGTVDGDAGWEGMTSFYYDGQDTDAGKIIMTYGADEIAPFILSRHSPLGVENISRSAIFRFEFNESIVPEAVRDEWITLFETNNPDVRIPIVLSYEFETHMVTLVPEELTALQPNTAYTVEFSQEIQDLHGLAMESDHRYSFKTLSQEFNGIKTVSHLLSLGGGVSGAMKMTDNTLFIAHLSIGGMGIRVGRSYNEGADWSFRTIPISDEVVPTGIVSIAADWPNVFISFTYGNDFRIGVYKSGDNGETWTVFKNDALKGVNGYQNELSTSVALDGQNLYVAYMEMVDLATVTLAIEKYSYVGTDWSFVSIPSPRNVENAYNGYYASTQFMNNTLYVSHTGYYPSDTNGAELYLTKLSADLQDSVTTTIDEWWPGAINYTALAMEQLGSETHIYIAYINYINNIAALKLACSTDDGATFSTFNVDDLASEFGSYPSIAVSGEGVFISYFDKPNGILKLARSEDQGRTWQISTVDQDLAQIDDDAAIYFKGYSSIAAKGDRIFISYYDANNSSLKLAKSSDRGYSWE